MKKRYNLLLGIVFSLVLLLSACGEDTSKKDDAANADQANDKQQEQVQDDKKEEDKKEEDKKEEEKEDISDDGKIIVYISGPQTMIEKLEAEFEAVNGDVIDIFHAGCGQLRQKVYTEAEAENIKADVFWGSNPLIYYLLEERGLLMAYSSPELENLKDEYKLDTDKFSLVSARYEVLVHNKDIAKEEAPKSFEDLLDSKWDGKVAFTDISQSSTAFALGTALWDMNDKTMDFFEGLKANNVLLVPKSKAVAEKIQSGEIEVGIVPYDAIFRIKKKSKKEGFESKLAPKWPSEGAILLERPIAIIKNDDRSEAKTETAKKFVDFILSKKAQTIMAKFGFTSVRNDVEQVQGIPEDLNPTRINWKEAEKSEQLIRDEFKKVMVGN